ncbi:MAG: hypothetical protein K6G88_06895 [Lachnospiraceae bacterium]|nr:hypothetical protein [Lachnospiraceae bacterium]
MKKIIYLFVIIMLTYLVGCSKNELIKNNDGGKKAVTNKHIHNIMNCDDYVAKDGDSLLHMKSIEKKMIISKNKILKIIMKKGSPNGMNIYVLDKNDNFIFDVMSSEDISEKITDDYGMPIKSNYYEVGVYDLDNDNYKEIIFSVMDKRGINIYIFTVKNDNSIEFNQKVYKEKVSEIDVNDIFKN